MIDKVTSDQYIFSISISGLNRSASMETDLDWIKRWGKAYGVEKRLRNVLASNEGRKVVSWFKYNSLPCDAIAFALCRLAWRAQGRKRLPKAQLKRGIALCHNTAQWLRTNAGILGTGQVEQ